ncbi:MAG: DUF4105 domain-containing protein [Xanthomonadales bacterium]
MSWIRGVLLLVALLGAGSLTAAEPESSGDGIWLVTYGPGEIYWQRFGHNAIRVRDRDLGLDHTFNFGFFDFAQEHFFWRFLQGRMLYFSAAQPTAEEFAQYRAERRSIRMQRLALDRGQSDRLVRYLLREVQPEHRDYRYDYYRNNCSTRVRDALDRALDGRLSAAYRPIGAAQNWRAHTRRLTQTDFWLYLGLEIVLGAPVDEPIDAWEEMFIPARLADAVARLPESGAPGARPLVTDDRVLFESPLPPPPAEPGTVWPRYLLAALAAVFAAFVAGRWLPPAFLARAWLLVSGAAGLALLFFWFGTDHAVARANLNILVLNPLWLAFVPRSRVARYAFPMVTVFAAAALAMPWLPPGQYTADVLAALLPLNLAAAWSVHGAARRRT